MANVKLGTERGKEISISDVDGIEIRDHGAKEAFLAQWVRYYKELERRQCKYKRILSLAYKSRNDTIIEKSVLQAVERLRLERNDIRAQAWVADGKTHLRENDIFLNKIQCHVKCQDRLSNHTKALKKDIANMERGIQNLNREIYDLNLKTVPDSQFQAHVAAERKKLVLLENRLEVGMRQESCLTALNFTLREKVNNILNERKHFHETYTKLMQTLTTDKKYLIDLMECAFGLFENCIEAHEKIEIVLRKHDKEKDARKIEAQSLMRHKAADQEIEDFINAKTKIRKLNDLQPKEYKRRETFTREHQHKIQLYKRVLTKLLKYSNAQDVDEVTDRFQQQESLYYSYFSFANEIGYHVTLLNNSVNRLYFDVENLRKLGKDSVSMQMNTITELTAELREKKQGRRKLNDKKEQQSEALGRYVAQIEEIVKICRVNTKPLKRLIGNFSNITISNIRHFTKLLEIRVVNVVAAVYCSERDGFDPSNQQDKLCIKDIVKFLETPTDLSQIVLTQQCPECAEGEAFNMDEMTDVGVHVHSAQEAKQNLFDKVNQPEMQYRLHSISQCRLPRSRILAAKRFN